MFLLLDNKIFFVILEKGFFVYDYNKVKEWNIEVNDFIKKNIFLGGVIIKNKFIVLNFVLNGIIICDLNGKII